MTPSIDSEIKELIGKLDQKLDKLDDRLKNLEIGQAKIEGKFDALDGRIKQVESSMQKIPDLAEKVGELKNWRQIALIVITGTVGTLFGWVVRTGRL